MILLPAIFYDSVSYGRKKRKFVLDKLKPLMVAKYYSTSSTESFYYPSVLMDCIWYYLSLNSLYNQIFTKIKVVGKSVSSLNGPNALVTPKQKVLSLSILRLRSLKSQIIGSCKSTLGKYYNIFILFFHKHPLLASISQDTWLGRPLVMNVPVFVCCLLPSMRLSAMPLSHC